MIPNRLNAPLLAEEIQAEGHHAEPGLLAQVAKETGNHTMAHLAWELGRMKAEALKRKKRRRVN